MCTVFIRCLFIKRSHIILLSFTLISGFLISIGLVLFSTNKIQNIDVNLEFDEKNAYDSIEDQLDIGYRIPGTKESNETVNYFISKFKKIDINFSFFIHNFEVHSTRVQNVLFKLNENEKKIVILGAHYDSRAKATKEDSDDPVPGANDGASGTAVLIELAKVLYKQRNKLDVQIWFVFFDAEDQGKDEGGYGMDDWDWCEGSEEFVDNLDNFYDSENEEFDCMILLDMVGGEGLQFIKEQYSSSSLLDEIFEIGRQLGYIQEFPIFPTSSTVQDDHVSFIEEDIPSADLIINFWSNPNWPHHHTKDDDISHISKKSLEITGKTVEQFIYNNYLDDSNDSNEKYIGYYPWEEDVFIIYYAFMILSGVLIMIGVIIALIINHFIIKKKEPSIKD